MADRFWERKTLAEMSEEEWESLCDGCAKCCLLKLVDHEDDDTIYFTDVACHLLNPRDCRCRDYDRRHIIVPGCAKVTAGRSDLLAMMPPSCAYRRIAEGRGLPDWHHLICGDRQRIHREGHSVWGKTVIEGEIDDTDWEDHIVEWPLDE